MKTLSSILLFASLSVTSFAQKQKITSGTTPKGVEYEVGTVLKLKTGTNPDGSFRWIFENRTGFAAYALNDRDRRMDDKYLSVSYANSEHKIVKISNRGKSGTVPLISGAGGFRYEVNIDMAIRDGEIEPLEQLEAAPVEETRTLSVEEYKKEQKSKSAK